MNRLSGRASPSPSQGEARGEGPSDLHHRRMFGDEKHPDSHPALSLRGGGRRGMLIGGASHCSCCSAPAPSPTPPRHPARWPGCPPP